MKVFKLTHICIILCCIVLHYTVCRISRQQRSIQGRGKTLHLYEYLSNLHFLLPAYAHVPLNLFVSTRAYPASHCSTITTHTKLSSHSHSHFRLLPTQCAQSACSSFFLPAPHARTLKGTALLYFWEEHIQTLHCRRQSCPSSTRLSSQ